MAAGVGDCGNSGGMVAQHDRTRRRDDRERHGSQQLPAGVSPMAGAPARAGEVTATMPIEVALFDFLDEQLGARLGLAGLFQPG